MEVKFFCFGMIFYVYTESYFQFIRFKGFTIPAGNELLHMEQVVLCVNFS